MGGFVAAGRRSTNKSGLRETTNNRDYNQTENEQPLYCAVLYCAVSDVCVYTRSHHGKLQVSVALLTTNTLIYPVLIPIRSRSLCLGCVIMRK